MALKPCKECGRDISTEAATCPHCGKKNPTGARTSPAAIGCLVVVVLGLIGALVSSGNNSTPSSPLVTAPPSKTPAQITPPVAGTQWNYSHDTDEMTSKVSHMASVSSDNTVEFDFPYQGAQHGQLLIRRHPRFGNDVIFSIQKGQLLCTSYDGCTVLVRFDNGEPQSFSANPPGDNSTETIFISNYERFMSKMRAAKRLRISPKVYQEGSIVFTFDVSGFDVKRFRGE